MQDIGFEVASASSQKETWLQKEAACRLPNGSKCTIKLKVTFRMHFGCGLSPYHLVERTRVHPNFIGSYVSGEHPRFQDSQPGRPSPSGNWMGLGSLGKGSQPFLLPTRAGLVLHVFAIFCL